MSTYDRTVAKRTVRAIVDELQAEGAFVFAEAVRRIGNRVIGDEDDGAVFPLAAASPRPAIEPTVRAKA